MLAPRQLLGTLFLSSAALPVSPAARRCCAVMISPQRQFEQTISRVKHMAQIQNVEKNGADPSLVRNRRPRNPWKIPGYFQRGGHTVLVSFGQSNRVSPVVINTPHNPNRIVRGGLDALILEMEGGGIFSALIPSLMIQSLATRAVWKTYNNLSTNIRARQKNVPRTMLSGTTGRRETRPGRLFQIV